MLILLTPSGQERAKLRGRVALHVWQRVRVDLKRLCHLRMPQPLRHHLNRDACSQEQRCRGVSRPVRLDSFHASRLHDAPEVPLYKGQTGLPERCRRLLKVLFLFGEHEAVVFVRRSVRHHQLTLVLPVRSQPRDRVGAERHRASLSRFRRDEYRSFTTPRTELLRDRDGTGVEVYGAPDKPERFAFSTARIEQQREEC